MMTWMRHSQILLQLFLVLSWSQCSWSQQVGSGSEQEPLFNCLSQEPTAGHTHDPGSSPAWITVSSVTFYPGQEISVNLVSRYPLRSYMLQARSEVNEGVDSWSAGGPHGWWPQDTHSFRCLSAADTIYYNSDLQYVAKVKVTWTAAASSSSGLPKEIYFRASVVAADGQIWTNIKSFKLKQIKQSDVTTQAPKTSAVTKNPVSRTTIQSFINSTQSVVNRIRQSIIEENIVEFEQRKKQLLTNDDYGNEGDWTRLRERGRMEHKSHIRLQLVAIKKRKQEDEQQRQQMLKFEIADREAHVKVEVEGGEVISATTLHPVKPADNGTGDTVSRNTLYVIISPIIIWLCILYSK